MKTSSGRTKFILDDKDEDKIYKFFLSQILDQSDLVKEKFTQKPNIQVQTYMFPPCIHILFIFMFGQVDLN
jgi:hypothetical protein